jgi:hypothetical protein
VTVASNGEEWRTILRKASDDDDDLPDIIFGYGE